MVRFTDDANRFWLEQSLDKGEMPKRYSAPVLVSLSSEVVVDCEGGRCRACISVPRDFMGGNWKPDPRETFTLWFGEIPVRISEVSVHYV